MDRNKERMVHVMARQGADLVRLSSCDSPMMGPCGTVGTGIAKKVLEGNRQALISVSDIRMAIDTMDGVNVLLDNFDLTDPNSQSPLIYALLMEQRLT